VGPCGGHPRGGPLLLEPRPCQLRGFVNIISLYN
jgi:hypothetical protein